MNMQYSLMFTFLCQHTCTQGGNKFLLQYNGKATKVIAVICKLITTKMYERPEGCH